MLEISQTLLWKCTQAETKARPKPQDRWAEEKDLWAWSNVQMKGWVAATSRALHASVLNCQEGLSREQACEERSELKQSELSIPVSAARILALRFLTQEAWWVKRSGNLGNHSLLRNSQRFFLPKLLRQRCFLAFQGFQHKTIAFCLYTNVRGLLLYAKFCRKASYRLDSNPTTTLCVGAWCLSYVWTKW